MADEKSAPKTNDQPAATPQPETKPEVDRIREIIFGSQMRDYGQRFQELMQDVERLQQELDRLSEQLIDQDRDHAKKQQALRRDMRQSDDTLRGELRQTAEQIMVDKVDRLALGDLFVELGNHLKEGGSLSLADLIKSLGGVE